MNSQIPQDCIKTSIEEDEGSTLFSPHFLLNVLPNRRSYQKFDPDPFINSLAELRFKERIKDSKRNRDNESQTEDHLIVPILQLLNNGMLSQGELDGDHTDFLLYPPGTDFEKDFGNTYSVVESKRVGRLRNKYFAQKSDNSDEIYQIRNYLRGINETLNNLGKCNNVEFAVLTDGVLWRLYSRRFTHSKTEFETHFLEFDLEQILSLPETEDRYELLKLFAFVFRRKSLETELIKVQRDAQELELAVSKALREQTFTALEFIATGIWRQLYVEQDPLRVMTMASYPEIDMSLVHSDENERAKLLKFVFDESLVYLLRLLFLLYGEDRQLFDTSVVPKVVKGDGNLLDLIVSRGYGIGQVDDPELFKRNDDVRISEAFIALDTQYNGGLFSPQDHMLIHKLDIDDALFVNAVDNLCRVEVKKKAMAVDFSSISVRELGSIYEGLLEYELTIADRDIELLPSVVNSKRFRYDVRAGDLYLVNQDGDRKASGSYYTPDLIVDHLVSTALVPKLNEIADGTESFETFLARILELSIVDPSMGSGHMLVSAFNAIMSAVHKRAEAEIEANADFRWNSERTLDIRSQVARSCIYGVDLNPVAVDLAKLVMWMQIFRPDRPFEFFDYNLQCGNSLIGVEKNEVETGTRFGADGTVATTLFRNQEELIADVQNTLLNRLHIMAAMPRETIDDIHAVESYWDEQVVPLQRQLGFVSNISLVKWLEPDSRTAADRVYNRLIEEFDADFKFVERILERDASMNEDFLELAEINDSITKRYRPFHWHINFPDVAVKGGFDVVLSNPPWDRVKVNRNEFFPRYIPGYDKFPTASKAKAASNALIKSNDSVREAWVEYESSVKNTNDFYADFYSHQRAKNAKGKILRGDANLFKVFIERIYGILKPGGSCGIVIPDNFNIDAGATGLRRLILNQTRLRELIMFENRKRLFKIHGQYKFNVMTFDKRLPTQKGTFDAGFYWYDPMWLDGEPNDDHIAENRYNAERFHNKFKYSVSAIKKFDPDTLTIFEIRSKKELEALEKMHQFPSIGDTAQAWSIRTYREFDMTNDSDLFNFDRSGWPLYQGGSIHLYDASFHTPEKFVAQSDGESRLAEKWGITKLHDMPTRRYRIACRAIAQPTDTRSLICTVLPRGAFTGNSLTVVDVLDQEGESISEPAIIAGVNALLSSVAADFYIRSRIAKNVNAFILRSLPAPRDYEWLQTLGRMSLPLFQGDQFESFRDSDSLNDERERMVLRAKIDAMVAHKYEFSIENFQSVLATFPNIEESYKDRAILEFNELTFSH